MEEPFIDGYALIKKKLTNWVETLVEMLPNLMVAFLVLLFFYFLAKTFRKLTARFLSKVLKNDTIVGVISLFVQYFILFEGLFIALNALELDQTVTQLLAGAGIIGLGLSFAFQSIATNLISGIIIAAQRPLRNGDLIESNGLMGVVESIDLRVVKMKTFTGEHILIPSKDIIENPLTNYSYAKGRKVHMVVGVSYGEDLEKVEKVTLAAVNGISERDQSKEILLAYRSFDDSSISFDLYFWVENNNVHDFLKSRSAAVKAIKMAYDAHNITIPFPIRTLDFGIKGGKQLDEVVLQSQQQGHE